MDQKERTSLKNDSKILLIKKFAQEVKNNNKIHNQ